MFKIVCNLKIRLDLEPVFLQYINCRPQSFFHLNLTSTSHQQDSEVSSAIAEKMSRSGLNPHNPNYQEVYAKFTSAEASIANSRYILICEDNKFGVSNFPKSALNPNREMFDVKSGHNVVFLYEGIFENGDHMLWGKYNYIYFHEGKPSLKPGIMKEITSGEFAESFHLDAYFRDYLLDVGFSHSYSVYVASLKSAVIAKLNKALSKFMDCQVNGESVVFLDASSDASQTQDIKTMCAALGGKILTIEESLQQLCSATIDREKIFYGNEAFNITCDNFKYVLHESVTHPYMPYEEL